MEIVGVRCNLERSPKDYSRLPLVEWLQRRFLNKFLSELA